MTWVVIAIVVVVLVGVVIAVVQRQKRRSEELQGRFGPEYDEVVSTAGSRREAEAELADREERHAALDIRPLDADRRGEYSAAWQDVQAQFVDGPTAAVGNADRLVHRVMRDRGYPVEDFEQRAADISVEHASVVFDYRAAHEISQRNDAGDASTEDLRQAMVHYRALFEDLLVVETGDVTMKEARHG